MVRVPWRWLRRTSLSLLLLCIFWYFLTILYYSEDPPDVYQQKTHILEAPQQLEGLGSKWLPRPSVNYTKRPTLEVPKHILGIVQSDEWLSRTINDMEKTCAVSLKGRTDDSVDQDMSCKIPHIDPFHPSMKKLFIDIPMPDCSKQKSYGILAGGKLSFNDPDVVSATYRSITRDGDFATKFGDPISVVPETKITDEFIEVNFLLKDGRRIKEIFIQPVRHEHLVNFVGKKKPGIPLNILIVGVDSLAHANAVRKLSKAYEFLKNELHAFIFNGHSVVGDATLPQMTAMLTGLSESEQYEARRHHENPKPVDGWNWIYKQLKEHGYLTGYSGDDTQIAPFQLRLVGFKDQPTDFYARPFYQHVGRLYLGGYNKCLGSKTISQRQFAYLRELFDTFPDKLKFFLAFNAVYSHGTINDAAKIGPNLFSFLQNFKESGHLNNTLLIVMGDHGSRYGPSRALIQGKLEERLPLFTMTFPPWFLKQYPKIAENLRMNTNRLTSWFDIYATFRHMLSYPQFPSDMKHGQSILEEVPLSRTCADANVKPHWCPCLQMAEVNVDHSHVQNAALATVEHINNLINEHSVSAKYCQILSLKRINYALVERPNEKLLAFMGSHDRDPVFRFNSKPEHVSFCRYQLQITTSPNNGIYEATVRYYNGWFMVSKGISRIDIYGKQPECVSSYLPHLRKYCFCTKAR